MTSLLTDFVSAFRFFSRRRAAFLVSVLTIALAIGANTAVFSVLQAFVFANLGVNNPARVAILPTTKVLPGRGAVDFFASWPNYERLRAGTHSFSHLAAILNLDFNWDQGDQTTRLAALRVTDEYLGVMGVAPQLGRYFLPTEQGPGATASVLISDRLWHEAFNADPAVLGQHLRLNGESFTVVGVMPPRLEHPFNAQIWVPFDLPEEQWTRINGGRQLTIMARLADGVTMAAASQDLHSFAVVNQAADAANKDWDWRVQPLQEQLLEGADNALLMVQVGAGVLLILAICNLAAVLLAWAGERAHENALRVALGAGQWRLVRQYLVQSLVLVTIGGTAGVMLANLSLPLMQYLNPNPALAAFLEHLSLDGTALAFAALLVLGTALLAGLLPALQARHFRPADVLRAGGRSVGVSRATLSWQQGMVVVQAGIAVLILTTAALAGTGFKRLASVDLGFTATDRAVFRVEFPTPSFNSHEQRSQFVEALETELAAEPAIAAYGFSSTIPVGDIQWGGGFYPQLSDGTFTDDPQTFHFRRVSPGYTAVMGIPLMEGRLLSTHDTARSQPVALISRSLAEKYWPGENSIGRMLRPSVPVDAPLVEIVGIVGDVRDAGAGFPAAEAVYVPFAQKSVRRGWVVMAGRGSVPETLAAGLRALRRASPAIAPIDANFLDTLVWRSHALPRLQVFLLGSFGAIALLMSALGTYGVMSQLVACRRRDLAIRLALGATRPHALGQLHSRNARLSMLGVIVGLLSAWVAAHALATHVTGFDADPLLPYVGSGLIIALFTQVASWIPAYRASQVPLAATLSAEG